MASSHGMDEHFPQSSAGTIPTTTDQILIWVTCGYCWGGRRVFQQDEDGLWYWQPCPPCGGLGETAKLVDR